MLQYRAWEVSDAVSVLCSMLIQTFLSRKSHGTYPKIPDPTPPSFPLDFAQLLQATTANPASRPRIKRHKHGVGEGVARERIEEVSREAEEDGWDLVDDDV